MALTFSGVSFRIVCLISAVSWFACAAPGNCESELQKTLKRMKPATGSLSKSGFDAPGDSTSTSTSTAPIEGSRAVITTTAPLSTTVDNRPVTDKWALVVGVSKFQDPTIPSLNYAAKDAKDFADYLVKKANFAPDHVRVLTNEQATQRRIISELGDKFLPRVVKKDDLVVVFFSSHGSPANKDVAKENFLVAYDTYKNDLFATGIEASNITRLLRERLDAKRILIVMDACHAGGGADSAKGLDDSANFDLNQLALGGGQMLISSSNADERSWESKRYKNGIFTHHLMQSMDKNGGNSTISTVFQDMQSGVEQEVQQDDKVSQTPKLRNDQWTGNDLVLAVRPANPQPLPPLVKQYFALATASTPVVAHEATSSTHAKPAAKPVVASAIPVKPVAVVASVPAAPVIQFKPMPDSKPASTGSSSNDVNNSNTANGNPGVSSANNAWIQDQLNGSAAGGGSSNSAGTSTNPGNFTGANNVSGAGSNSNSFGGNGFSAKPAGANFEPFTLYDGSMSVMMPRGLVAGNAIAGSVKSITPNVTYAVAFNTFAHAEKLFPQYLAGFLKSEVEQGYILSPGQKRNVNGYVGMEYKVTNGVKTSGLLLVHTRNRIYTFAAIINANDDFNQVMPFFNSIMLR